MGERARRPGDEATRVTGVNPGHPAPTKCTCVVGAYRIRPVCFADVGVGDDARPKQNFSDPAPLAQDVWAGLVTTRPPRTVLSDQ